MRVVKVTDMRTTLLLLIETQQYNRISSVIDLSVPTFNDSDDWNTLLELMYRVPENIRMESIPLALYFARALSQTYQVQELFAFCDAMLKRHGIAQVAEIEIVRGMALHILHKYQEALECLESAIKYLQGEALGFAYSKLGLVLFCTRETLAASLPTSTGFSFRFRTRKIINQ
jgi:tetratricopeptide (TPR) repeat protein